MQQHIEAPTSDAPISAVGGPSSAANIRVATAGYHWTTMAAALRLSSQLD
jgi:hypothetical protein